MGRIYSQVFLSGFLIALLFSLLAFLGMNTLLGYQQWFWVGLVLASLAFYVNYFGSSSRKTGGSEA
jgi:hypothetical protein